MKERPILFNSAMVKAVLDGRKTQTRRVIKPQPEYYSKDKFWDFGWAQFYDSGFVHTSHRDGVGGQNWQHEEWSEENKFSEALKRTPFENPCPFGKVGDHLWVRETHTFIFRGKNETSLYGPEYGVHSEFTEDGHFNIEYAATYEPEVIDWDGGWKPSIHMPRWASRITLETTGVRVERLQDISNEDARSEGVMPLYADQVSKLGHPYDACAGFKNLWESINGEGSWNLNPFVWVVEFKRIK